MPEENDRCVRAAQAAIEVVEEECKGMDVEIKETHDGTFVRMPTDSAERLENVGNSPISPREFEHTVKDDKWLGGWLGGMCDQYSGRRFRECIFDMGDQVTDNNLDFEPREITDATIDAIRG